MKRIRFVCALAVVCAHAQPVAEWNQRASDAIGSGAYADAERDYRRAMALVEAAKGKESADYAMLLAQLANLHRAEGRPAAARSEARDAAAIASRMIGPEDERAVEISLSLANALLANDDLSGAEQVLLKLRPRQARSAAAVWNDLGTIAMRQRKYRDAAALLEKSVAAGAYDMLIWRPLLNLANAYAALARVADAEAAFQRAMEIVGRDFPPNHPFFAEAARCYAEFLRKQGRKTEAKRLQAAADAATRNFQRNNNLGLTVSAADFR